MKYSLCQDLSSKRRLIFSNSFFQLKNIGVLHQNLMSLVFVFTTFSDIFAMKF